VALTKDDLPKYWELMYPVLKAADALGGSGNKKEIRSPADHMWAVPGSPGKAILQM